MQEMISLPKEWFSKIDIAPHVDSAYSNNSGTGKAFWILVYKTEIILADDIMNGEEHLCNGRMPRDDSKTFVVLGTGS